MSLNNLKRKKINNHSSYIPDVSNNKEARALSHITRIHIHVHTTKRVGQNYMIWVKTKPTLKPLGKKPGFYTHNVQFYCPNKFKLVVVEAAIVNTISF